MIMAFIFYISKGGFQALYILDPPHVGEAFPVEKQSYFWELKTRI
jgi:hypothetical protein